MELALLTSLLLAIDASAQGGHVAGSAGLSAGTGGPAPAVTVSAGYQPSQHIGFALELSVLPHLDFGTRELGEVPAFTPLLPVLPTTTITETGSLTAVQVDVIVPLTTAGKLRVAAVAGGGTASLRTRSHLHRDAFMLPGISLPEPFNVPALILAAEDITRTVTATGLALNTGVLIEYALRPKLGVGVDVRYSHTSASRDIDTGRTTARVVWRF
jgi:hypothetical protein